MGLIVKGDTRKEKTLKHRISLLKKKEKEIREERHRLESELRNLICQKYTRMGKKLGSKIQGI